MYILKVSFINDQNEYFVFDEGNEPLGEPSKTEIFFRRVCSFLYHKFICAKTINISILSSDGCHSEYSRFKPIFPILFVL